MWWLTITHLTLVGHFYEFLKTNFTVHWLFCFFCCVPTNVVVVVTAVVVLLRWLFLATLSYLYGFEVVWITRVVERNAYKCASYRIVICILYTHIYLWMSVYLYFANNAIRLEPNPLSLWRFFLLLISFTVMIIQEYDIEHFLPVINAGAAFFRCYRFYHLGPFFFR